MAKVAEKWIFEGGKLVHKKTHDYTPELRYAQMLRDAGAADQGESKLVGVFPTSVINEFLKKAGVSWDDPARDDVIKRAIMSGELDKFRVWKGKY